VKIDGPFSYDCYVRTLCWLTSAAVVRPVSLSDRQDYFILFIGSRLPVVTFLGHVAVLECPVDYSKPVKHIYWITPRGDTVTSSDNRSLSSTCY
jgi:hypothetical protein